jgi:plastocyanin domain-containing protein
LEKIVTALTNLGFKPRLPVKIEDFSNPNKLERWFKEKMQAFTFWNPKKSFEEVDILINNPLSFDDLYESKKVIVAEGVKIPLISIENLIRLKEMSGRKQDEADVKALKKIRKLRK